MKKSLNMTFHILANPAIALVPSKLIRNLTKEWNQFDNINDTLLNIKLLIGDSQARSEEILTKYIQNGLLTDYNSSLAKTVTRFLIITVPSSYQSNIVKTLEQTFYSSYVLIGKVRTVHRQELEQREVWRQVY